MSKIASQIRALFGRGTRQPVKLSPNVVQHARIDEIVHDDLVSKSSFYRDAIEREFVIDDDGEPKPYEPVGDLRADLFYSHYASGESVDLKDTDEVLPSRRLHQEIMRHYTAEENFLKCRAATRNDDLAAMLASMAAQDTLESELRTSLAEHAERAQQMAENEQLIENLSNDLDGLRNRAKEEKQQQGAVSPETQQQIRDAVNGRREAIDNLGQQAHQQQAAGVGMAAAQAVERAAEEAKDMADAFGSIPGLDMADHATMKPDEAFTLANRWRDGRLREIAKLFGRLERDFRYQRSNRVLGGRDEPVDVTLGDDIDLVLPDEFVKLHPKLRAMFFRDFAERTLVQYEMVGYESAGDGPLIVVIDTSGSMDAAVGNGLTRMDYASGVTLALMAVAAREKRAFAAIHCDEGVIQQVSAPKGRKLSSEDIIKVASVMPAGGTKLDHGIEAAEQIIASQPDFKSADVVVISDGDSRYESRLKYRGRYDSESEWLAAMAGRVFTTDDLCERLQAKGVRIHGIAIATAITSYLETITTLTGGSVTSVTEFWQPSKGLGQVAAAIT